MPSNKTSGQINMPVYSVCSYNGPNFNMNLCIYVTPISKGPKRYAVALAKGSQTLDNVAHTQHFILQVLSTEHTTLVNSIDQSTGLQKSELKAMRQRLSDHKGFKILKDAIAVMEMSVLSLSDVGDHMLAVCEVVSSKKISTGEVLTLDHLTKDTLDFEYKCLLSKN